MKTTLHTYTLPKAGINLCVITCAHLQSPDREKNLCRLSDELKRKDMRIDYFKCSANCQYVCEVIYFLGVRHY
jgi:hypothetical protein